MRQTRAKELPSSCAVPAATPSGSGAPCPKSPLLCAAHLLGSLQTAAFARTTLGSISASRGGAPLLVPHPKKYSYTAYRCIILTSCYAIDVGKAPSIVPGGTEHCQGKTGVVIRRPRLSKSGLSVASTSTSRRCFVSRQRSEKYGSQSTVIRCFDAWWRCLTSPSSTTPRRGGSGRPTITLPRSTPRKRSWITFREQLTVRSDSDTLQRSIVHSAVNARVR